MARIVNCFGGPGSGKSTTAMRLAADLKAAGYNAEFVQEHVKGAAWEKRSEKYFKAQDLIFAKQHWDIDIVAQEVDLVITDSPVLMSICYIPDNFKLPSLRKMIREAHDAYESLNVYMKRGDKPYNPKGRNQTKDEAMIKDREIFDLLVEEDIDYIEMKFQYPSHVDFLAQTLQAKGWLK
jgi:nicotinamide riboside kinase